MSSVLSAGRPSAKQSAKTKICYSSILEKHKRVNFNISESNHLKLKVYAAEQGLTITQVLHSFIESLPNK